ncbi:MAG TPA: hypothetical protein VN828_07650, partial [Acidobacteriaceae bacterium]|nr:hypothetical protein [Acidobacteriaceae bacterium]
MPWKAIAAFASALLVRGIAAAQTPADRAIDLALKGRCSEAMPLLDQAMRDPATQLDTKRSVSFAGVRCSMLLNQQNDAMSFLG